MSVVNMPFLFDRPIPATHAWYGGLHELSTSADIEDLSLHGNLCMEHRIPDRYHLELVDDVQKALNTSTTPHLRTALQKQFQARYIRPPSSVRFLGTDVRLPNSVKLVHVTGLGGMFKRLFANPASAEILRDALDLTLGVTRLLPPDKASWRASHTTSLAKALNECEQDEFAAFFDVVHGQIAGNAPCWWAALESELKKQSNELNNAEQIVHALGLGSFEPDEFLLIYRYRVRDAGLLYQPTTVESNAYVYHFPNPPVLTPLSGVSMPLTNGLLPCSEYLHHPLSNSKATAALERTILSLDQLPEPSSIFSQVKILRDAHRQQLHRNYLVSQENVDWLKRHERAF